jgi:hypothetical protein
MMMPEDARELFMFLNFGVEVRTQIEGLNLKCPVETFAVKHRRTAAQRF